ncbi:MAG: hypothetical protein U0525_01945 [Patescibacteria group bacterium]
MLDSDGKNPKNSDSQTSVVTAQNIDLKDLSTNREEIDDNYGLNGRKKSRVLVPINLFVVKQFQSESRRVMQDIFWRELMKGPLISNPL